MIASAVGGALETVEHGVNGVLVPPRDPRSLHDAVRKLVTDSRCRAVLAHAARPRTLDRFGWPRVTEALLAAYAQVTDEADPDIVQIPEPTEVAQ